MKNLLFACMLLIMASCNAGQNDNTNADTAAIQGNSPGADIIGADTMHIDTNIHSISPK